MGGRGENQLIHTTRSFCTHSVFFCCTAFTFYGITKFLCSGQTMWDPHSKPPNLDPHRRSCESRKANFCADRCVLYLVHEKLVSISKDGEQSQEPIARASHHNITMVHYWVEFSAY